MVSQVVPMFMWATLFFMAGFMGLIEGRLPVRSFAWLLIYSAIMAGGLMMFLWNLGAV